MQTIQKHQFLIGLYVCLLSSLLLCVSVTPLMIRHGIAISHAIVIEEEITETALIMCLFGISFLILRRFLGTLKSYQVAVENAGNEKSRLISRLAEAFNYIGTVNVELQELESLLCGTTCFPRSKREYKVRVDQMAIKAMTVATVPWLVVRMIDRGTGKTIYEHTVRRAGQGSSPAHLGNRAILDGQPVAGVRAIGSKQRNLDLMTVLILPPVDMADDRSILLMAILNQIEMLFMIYRAVCLHPKQTDERVKKEITQRASQPSF